jgi:hypothetical protein
MRSILTPAVGGAVINQGLDQQVGSFLRVIVISVEDEADNVVWAMVLVKHRKVVVRRRKSDALTHFSQSDGKRANEIESRLMNSLLGDRVLEIRVITGDFANGREKQMRAVRNPINPFQFIKRRDSLKCFISYM